MRVLSVGTNRFTQVIVEDEPGPGSACHEYKINGAKKKTEFDRFFPEYGKVIFQRGPIKLNGVNGCHQEDLLAIVIDRLRGFQSGDFRCRENAIALTKIEEALHWLNSRTADRQLRGVEGTDEQ